MQSFFHCRTEIYKRRCKCALVLIAAPIFQGCIIALLTMYFNFRQLNNPDFSTPLLLVTGGCIAFVMLAGWYAFERTRRAIKRNSRYTYFDIGVKVLVFSRYAGEFTCAGKRTIMRKLYVIPLKSFESAEYDDKKHTIIIYGKVRKYVGDSNRLGYHFRKGIAEFDNYRNNVCGFTEQEELIVPDIFEHQRLLCDTINGAKKRFDEAPPPKVYKFQEAAPVRRRPIPRVMPENPVYLRKW